MLTQLLKAGLLLKAGIWLKPRAKGLILTISAVVFCWIIHSEYLAYVEHSGEKGYLAISYAIKWIVTLSFIAAYFFSSRKDLTKPLTRSEIKSGSTKNQAKSTTTNPDDGFDFLRSKKELETKADKTIKKG